jgi:hypothetical protein
MSAVVETKDANSRLGTVRKLLAKADDLARAGDQHSLNEAEALNERAAELIASYGIDKAMLAADGSFGDEIVDEVIIVGKPFAKEFTDLLWYVASNMRAKGRLIKRWNKELHGGRTKGGYEYGLRLFAYESDMERIKLVYGSVKNQALAGMSKIVDRSSTYGQTQKADRQSYLDGFGTAVYSRLQRAEREAQRIKQAELDEARDVAMIEGRSTATGFSTELVLSDRGLAVKVAMDAAYGITQAQRAKWAEDDKKASEAWEAGAADRERERAECKRCSKGRPCSQHGTAMGRSRDYQRVGSKWSAGYTDGSKADLSGSSGRQRISGTRATIEQ